MIWQVRPTDVPALPAEQHGLPQAGGRLRRARLGARYEIAAVRRPARTAGAELCDEPRGDEQGRILRSRHAFTRQLADQRKQQRLQQEAEAVHIQPRRRRSSSSTAAGVKQGTTFTFWALAGRRDEWITMAQILQQDLQKIGYNLSIQRSDVSTWLAKFFPAGKSYPNTIIANYFSMPPNPTFAMKQGQFGSCECNWKNNTFEALAAKAPGVKDEAARQVVYDKMQQIFSSYAPVARDRAPDEHRRGAEADHERLGGRAGQRAPRGGEGSVTRTGGGGRHSRTGRRHARFDG